MLRVSEITAVLDRYTTKSDASDATNSKITDKQMIKIHESQIVLPYAVHYPRLSIIY